MSFAVDPHGSGVHGSRPGTYMLGRERVSPRAAEETRLSRPVDPPVAFSFRGPPHPRSRDASPPAWFPGPNPGPRARRRKRKSKNEWAAAVEDLKTRHAPRRRYVRPAPSHVARPASRSPSRRAPGPLAPASSPCAPRPRACAPPPRAVFCSPAGSPLRCLFSASGPRSVPAASRRYPEESLWFRIDRTE